MAGLTKEQIHEMISLITTNSQKEINHCLAKAVAMAPAGIHQNQAATIAYASQILPSILASVIEANNEVLLRDVENLIDSKFS